MRSGRRALIAVLGAAIVVGSVVPAWAQAAPPTVGSTDRNDDHIADDLAIRLESAKAADPIAVLVRGIGAAKAQREVGRFDVRYDYATAAGFAATITASQVRALARVPQVVRVDADHVVTVQQASRVEPRPGRTSGARLDVTQPIPTEPPTPPSAALCVLDTGVDSRHDAFDNRPLAFTDMIGHKGVAYDDNGHGTHLAGVAAYLAPRSPLFVAKVLDEFGEGPESVVLAGLDWCVAQPGVRVVLAGFGGDGGDGGSVLEHAVDEAARRHGIIVVAAAGNRGDEPGSVSSPGTAAAALTVGAIAGLPPTDGTALARESRGVYLAPFSGRGPTTAGTVKPDVVAAGIAVFGPRAGTRNEYIALSGTSTAAARVAGAVAGALVQRSTPSATDINSAIRAAAADRGLPGPDPDWGAGVVQPSQIVESLRGQTPAGEGPAHTRLTGTARSDAAVDLTIQVPADPSGPQPLAATLLVADPSRLDPGSTGIDIELYDPDGVLVAESACPTYGDVGCGSGRQETVGVPEAAPGTWTLRVLVSGAQGQGQVSAFDLEVHRGSLPPAEEAVPSAP